MLFYRLGEIRDRSFEQQRYRASGLNLITAAIVLWKTVYLEQAINALRDHAASVDDTLIQFLSPLGWDLINLTGLAILSDESLELLSVSAINMDEKIAGAAG